MDLLVSLFDDIFGEHRKYNEDTNQIAYDCPACSEDCDMPMGDGKGNLEINFDKNVFNCWKCQEINRMSGKIPALLKRFASKNEIKKFKLLKPEAYDPTIIVTSNDYDEIPVVVSLPQEYKKLANCTLKDYKYTQALEYLKKRGITDKIIDNFDIGYCSTGDYFNRIIIPSYDINKNINYFVARWFDSAPTKIKYLNPDVEKLKIIFNEYKINWDATIYLVEGATDHIVVPNSIPLLGKVISEKLFELLYTKAKGYIVILLDDDAYANAIKLYNNLNFGDLRNRIRLCVPPVGFDPSKIFEKLGSNGIVKLLRNSYKPTEKELFYT